jgi:hypothetical protein
MNALASLVILFVSTGIVIAGWLGRRADRQRIKDMALATEAQ